MNSSKKSSRKIKSLIRSVVVMILLLHCSLLFLVGGIGDIAMGHPSKLFVFYIQDAAVIIIGLIIVGVSILYFVLGCFQGLDFVYEYLRVGRRSVLHFVYLSVWPGFINLIFCCFCLFHLGVKYGDGKVSGWMVFFGFDSNETMSGFRIAFCMGGYLLTILDVFIYMIDFLRSSTFGFLTNKQSVVGVYNFIEIQRRLAPRFSFHVTCFHYEQVRRERTIKETDSEGNETTRTEVYYETIKVTTWNGSRVWRYRQFADASGPFLLDGKHFFKNFIKVKLDYEIFFDSEITRESYEIAALRFYEENRWRDTNCDLTRSRNIPGFEKHVLAKLRDGEKGPKWANIWCYLICFCTGCQLLYRYCFDRVSGEQDFVLVKVVSDRNEIARIEQVDQNYDINFVIVPDHKNNWKEENASTVINKRELVRNSDPNVDTPLLKNELEVNPDYIPENVMPLPHNSVNNLPSMNPNYQENV